jgi:PhoH-like ATPase
VLDSVSDAPASHNSPRPSEVGERRTYVLDTNVLLYDPHALFVFDEHDILLPMTVIEEIDRFKRDLNETGRNARTISRILDELRARGSLRDGVRLDDGGVLRVEYQTHGPELDITWGPESNDNRILRQVLRLRQETKGYLALVTRDTNMRLKCDALGVTAEDYQNAHIEVDEQYSGVTERATTSEVVDEVHAVGHVALDVLGEGTGLYPQQIVILTAADAPSKTAMVRVDVRRRRLRKVARHKDGVWGIFARNKEQLFALELLLDDDIHLVTLNGSAGTGKTLLAIAAGLKKVADEGTYRKMLVSRPIFPLGRDIGFLPGDVGEKLNPWMKPIYDNLELLLSSTRHGRSPRTARPSPSTSTCSTRRSSRSNRSRTSAGARSPSSSSSSTRRRTSRRTKLKTVLTRAGEGTKIVLTGDPEQIDNPYVDAMSNGLTYTVERFKNSEIAGHVTLKKGERSPLAELAAQLL